MRSFPDMKKISFVSLRSFMEELGGTSACPPGEIPFPFAGELQKEKTEFPPNPPSPS
jgi:hypothetical protein